MAATSSFALTGWLLNTWGSFPTEREGEEELRWAPSALTRAGWKHHLYAAGEREGRRGGGRAEREVQSEEGLRFLEYWRHENPRDCI